MTGHKIIGRFIIAIALLWSVGCSMKESPKPVIYEGPMREAENVTLHSTEKDKLKVLLKAKKIIELINGDKEFPEGIYIEFYDETGKLSSVLQANHAYYFSSEKKWRGRGKVEVKNIEKNQQLNTEELFWRPDNKKIFTEKFVTIRLDSEVIYGTGLDALQDLSYYKITNPEGEFEVDE